jgi:hypothetical protein
MITSCRAAQVGHEGEFATGITQWMAGDDGPNAEAASRIVAETFLMWRTWLKSKMQQE